MPPHGKTNLVKAFIINYLKQLIFQKAVLKAVHRQTKTLYEYSTLRSESGKRTYSITAKRMISGLVLKYLNGERFVIQGRYKVALPALSIFSQAVPFLGLLHRGIVSPVSQGHDLFSKPALDFLHQKELPNNHH